MKKLFFNLLLINCICLCPTILFAQMQLSFTTSNYNGVNISCYGGRDGSATVHVTGGTPPYSYLWSNGNTTSAITGLPEGYYNVTVTDSDSVIVSDGLNLIGPKKMEVTLNVYTYNNGFNVSCFQCFNGSISSSVISGTPGYTYQWSDGSTLQNRTGLGADRYVLTVTDLNGCREPVSAFLKEPSGSWTINGNSGTNSATHFIGTTDNQDLVFKTAGQERLRLFASGGIKTSNLDIEILRTNRITSRLNDTVVNIGDSSIMFYTQLNHIGFTPAGQLKGLSIGNPNSGNFVARPTARGLNSIAIGTEGAIAYGDNSLVFGSIGTAVSGTHAIAIGDCYLLPSTQRYYNDKPYTLGVTFNSNLPTLFVSQAAGIGSTGNIGIGGIDVPVEKLHVVGNSIFTKTTSATITSAPLIQGKNNYSSFSSPDFTWTGDNTTGLYHPSDDVIAFATNGAESMRINNNGSVGIGTINPAGILEVSSNGTSVYITDKQNGAPNLNLKNNSGQWHFSGPRTTESNAFSIFWYDGIYHRDFSIIDNGNVCIGSSIPTQRLQVDDGNLLVRGTNNFSNNGDKAIIQLGDANNYIISEKNYGIKIGASGSNDAIRIWNNGTVGIGIDPSTQTSSGYSLLVGGKLGAREAWVQTSTTWPDYVFEKDYKLKPLEEVKKFVFTKHHLPGIPSAEEVEKSGGINLGEMQTHTIRELEELYLQLFKLNDRLKEVEKANAELIENINQLKQAQR